MKTLTKFAVFAAMLVGSGISQAATTTASIPMGVEVPKSCTFSNVSAGIIVPEDGSKAIGNFKMSCNTGYSVMFDTDSSRLTGGTYVKNAQNIKLPTNTSVTLWGVTNQIFSAHSYVDSFPVYIGEQSGSVSVKLNNPTTATTPAGVYTDTFYMTVTY